VKNWRRFFFGVEMYLCRTSVDMPMVLPIPREKQRPAQTDMRVRMEEYQYLQALKQWRQPMYDVLHHVIAEYEWQKKRIAELEYFQEQDKQRKHELMDRIRKMEDAEIDRLEGKELAEKLQEIDKRADDTLAAVRNERGAVA
jgi:hypothetical protein